MKTLSKIISSLSVISNPCDEDAFMKELSLKVIVSPSSMKTDLRSVSLTVTLVTVDSFVLSKYIP